jgi:hypothetical protein
LNMLRGGPGCWGKVVVRADAVGLSVRVALVRVEVAGMGYRSGNVGAVDVR